MHLRRPIPLLRGLAAAAALIAAAAPPAAAQSSPLAAQSPSGSGSFLRESDYRVGRIVYRLGVAGLAHCPEPFPLTGLLFHHLAEYRPADRAEAISRFAVDKGPGVLAVLPDSPAATAGLAAGDVLVSVNGSTFQSPVEIAAHQDPDRWRPLVEASEIQLEDQLRVGAVRLEVLRGGRPLSLTLGSVPGCPARSRLARSSQANAFADGRYAIMTTRFLPFFRNDDELAVAMAHELGHNILRHPQQLEAQGVPHGIFRHIGRNARLVRATEIEADRLSVRLLWSAGYDLNAIIPFWRRLYGRGDSIFQLISAHPGLRARERIINETLAELAALPRPQ